jgi:acyl-CoA synthetase (AMP-forming)/AMP-acid ligase II
VIIDTDELQKGVMISHRNVITNVLQIKLLEDENRLSRGQNGKPAVDVVLGLLPQSHIYGLVVISAAAVFRGGEFWRRWFLQTYWPYVQTKSSSSQSLIWTCISSQLRSELSNSNSTPDADAENRYRINMLYLVPPIIIQMVKSNDKCKKFDLSCVRGLFTGAAPLGAETAEALQKQYPEWKIRQGYGMSQ